MDNQNVVIIGAGPAGITTAIQLKRYDIKSIILEQDEVGGLLREANLVENYPGFPEGIWGPNLVSLFRRQLKDVGVSATFEKVLEMEYTGEVFLVKTNRRTLTSTFAVIATGTKSRKFSDLPIAPDVRDRIFYGVNPIRTVVGKKVAIIGAGDAAFDYALNFSRNNEVLILCRSEQTRCIPILREKCMKHKHISLCSEVSMKSIGGGRDRVVMVCTGNGSNQEWEIIVDYVVFALGRVANLEFLGEALRRNRDILTNAKRLYLVGDARNGLYRQTAICVGDGIKAAMEINENMREGRHENSG